MRLVLVEEEKLYNEYIKYFKKGFKKSTRKIIYTVLYIFSMIYATTPAILVTKNMLDPKNKGK
ncbi:ATPase involved in conjugal plasmid transfer domain protein (plasmid) [Clostridium botulinum]|uniref:ATPase involved in conjugal plasmid transfer domain protein n=1 Tax=Clostridium botulinum TaxID=1491 RepID=A0A1L7JMG7_CLOBO|nr:ATPase involved in conjugal plasmid transfer domain protein [Clostridium botulinum]